MSNTTSEPEHGPPPPADLAARPPRPPGASGGDPWPHEHGEHPSGLSVPDGPIVHRDHLAHLVGDPVVIRPDRRSPLRAVAWVAAAVAVAAGAVAVAVRI